MKKTTEEYTVRKKEPHSRRTGLPNPWTTVGSAKEAALGAGMETFAVPPDGSETKNGPVCLHLFRCMKGLAEARGEIGRAEIHIRKGFEMDSGDVSGDYNTYKYAWTIEAGGSSVKCRGNEEGRTRNAVWNAGGFSYALLVRCPQELGEAGGLEDETVSFLRETIR